MDDHPWPEHLLADNHPVRSWNARSDATWEAIRQDYLSGIPARDLCDRYEVALSTLRLKAKEGGWRRADQADSDLFPADADRWVADEAPDVDVAAGDEDWADLAARARFRLRRAIASGRAAEAASWLRVHDRLRALAADEGAPADPTAPVANPLAAATAVIRQVGSIARRAVGAVDEGDLAALEVEVEALQAEADALTPPAAPPEDGPTLDSLDSLDSVFSDRSDLAEGPSLLGRAALLRLRERRLELGLGVSDLDQALAERDWAWAGAGAGAGLSP